MPQQSPYMVLHTCDNSIDDISSGQSLSVQKSTQVTPIVCVGRFDTVRCRANTSLSRHVFTATAARANLLFQIGPCHACPHIPFIENLSTSAVDTSDMSLWQTTQTTHGSAALTIDNTFN